MTALLAYYRRRSRTLGPTDAYGGTWAYVLVRALDLFLAALIWRNYGVTISSFTGLELRKTFPAPWAIVLGAFLVFLSYNHCEAAIAADIDRTKQAQHILGVT